MALALYRRHTAACVERRQKAGDPRPAAVLKNDRSWRRCFCPIHAEGVLRKDGFIRKATGETTWEGADLWKAEVEERGTLAKPEADAETQSDGPISVVRAVEQFAADAKARNLDHETLKKYRVLFDQLTAFAQARGLEWMEQLNDVPTLMAFRVTWKDKGVSATKKLERFKSFGNFCTNAGYRC